MSLLGSTSANRQRPRLTHTRGSAVHAVAQRRASDGSVSRFASVFLDRPLERRVSQTFLHHYAGCERSGYLYAQTRDQGSSSELQRGSAVHAVAQRMTETMVAAGEPLLPPELAKVIVNEVLAEYPVPFDEHDYVRELAYRLAGELTIDPANVLACETLVVLELDGWQVRCKVDFAEARADGRVVYVADYKSARHAPSFDEIARKRKLDDTYAAKNIQLVLYALALAYGRVVTFEPCGCDLEEGGCLRCAGRGYVEVAEPFPLAAHADRFELEFVYPGIEDKDGMIVRRPVSLTRFELAEYRESLSAVLARVARSEQTGEWEAVQSEEACTYCPAKALCPIPVELRTYAGEVNTYEHAVQAAEVLESDTARLKGRREELKRWAKAYNVEIRYGRDRVMRFVTRDVDRIDKERMFEAVDAAVRFGAPFDSRKYVKASTSTNFVSETLTQEELSPEDEHANPTEEAA